jgi:signal transduction histidine kinase
MSISSESKAICRGLDEFCLPAVLMHIGRDRLLTWNRNFLEAVGCEEEELQALPVSELVVFGASSPEALAESKEPPSPIHFDACTVRSVATGNMLLGRSFRREDGYVFVMLDPVGIESSGSVAEAKLAGQQLERDRMRDALHRTVAQQLVALQFAVAALKNGLEGGRTPTTGEVDRLTGLLNEMGDSIRALTEGTKI